MPDNIALQSQQFAADRSREGNAYRMHGAEVMQQGLSSLVPGFQQAQRAQLDNMHATNELGMDELRRQESVQTLQFAQELHRTKMSRAQSDAALSAAELQIAQNNAAMKKLESEGYEKQPEWTIKPEEMDAALEAGWAWAPGGPRGLGKVREATALETKAAITRRQRRDRQKVLDRYLSLFGGEGVDAEGFLSGKKQLPERPYAERTGNPIDQIIAEQMRAKAEGAKNGAAAPAPAAPAAPQAPTLGATIEQELPAMLEHIHLAVSPEAFADPSRPFAPSGGPSAQWVSQLPPAAKAYIQQVVTDEIKRSLPSLIEQFKGMDHAEQRLRAAIHDRLTSALGNPEIAHRLMQGAPR